MNKHQSPQKNISQASRLVGANPKLNEKADTSKSRETELQAEIERLTKKGNSNYYSLLDINKAELKGIQSADARWKKKIGEFITKHKEIDESEIEGGYGDDVYVITYKEIKELLGDAE